MTGEFVDHDKEKRDVHVLRECSRCMCQCRGVEEHMWVGRGPLEICGMVCEMICLAHSPSRVWDDACGWPLEMV